MTATRTNPVDDRTFTRGLTRALVQHTQALADTIPGPAAHRTAAAWVYSSVLAVWAGDHGLVPARLRPETERARKEHAAVGGTTVGWLSLAIADIATHPATACLLDARYNPIRQAAPGEHAAAALVDWWTTRAPSLAYPVDRGPASITGWLAGDLLQAQEDEDRKAAALCQTPWWVADFLCERTLLPAIAEFGARVPVLRVIDPACGTGHILVWVLIGLYQWYRSIAPGHPACTPTQAIERALAGIHGVELDPLTAAVARLRLLVTAAALLADDGALPTPLQLHHIPATWRPRVAVGNALLAGLGDPHPPGTILDDTADYPGILTRGTYHAVIANPPYKVPRDPATREAIRAAYFAAVGRFPLSVPFTQLLFDLAIRGDDQPGHITTTLTRPTQTGAPC